MFSIKPPLYEFSPQNGTTLIELLVALGLIGLISWASVGQVTAFRSDMEMRNVASALKHILHNTRSLSLAEQAPRTFCLTLDFKACDANGNHWMTFHDLNHDRSRNHEAEPLMNVSTLNNQSIQISSNLKQGLVKFRGNGFGGATAGSYYVCQPQLNQAYVVRMSLIGKTRMQSLTLTPEQRNDYCGGQS